MTRVMTSVYNYHLPNSCHLTNACNYGFLPTLRSTARRGRYKSPLLYVFLKFVPCCDVSIFKTEIISIFRYTTCCK